MKPEAHQFLDYARDMLERGRRMLAAGLSDDAGRAAYLACFHTAQAYIFERKNRVVKTHRGVQSTFFLLTSNDPRVDPVLRGYLSRGFELKSIADYGVDPAERTSGEEAAQAIATAAQFVEVFGKLADEPAASP